MKANINGKLVDLTEQELEFVRDMIGEWEEDGLDFSSPVYIPVSELAWYFNKTIQGIRWIAQRRGVKLTLIGNTSFIELKDAINIWFKALK
jgi:hypothetical protein